MRIWETERSLADWRLARPETARNLLRATHMFPDAAERVIELGLWICEALLRVGGSPHDLSPSNVRVIEHRGMVQGVEIPDVAEGTRCVMTSDVASCMSRERACGLSCDVRADLYSVGCILFELAEGRPVFSGDLQDVLAKHVVVDPPRMRCTTPALGAIIDCLLEKEPADRYQTVEELRDALYAVLDDCHSTTRTAA